MVRCQNQETHCPKSVIYNPGFGYPGSNLLYYRDQMQVGLTLIVDAGSLITDAERLHPAIKM